MEKQLTVAEIKKKFLNEFVWYGNPDKTFEWFEPYLSNPAEPATEKEPVVKDVDNITDEHLEKMGYYFISPQDYAGMPKEERIRRGRWFVEENLDDSILAIKQLKEFGYNIPVYFSPVSQTKDAEEQKGKEITDDEFYKLFGNVSSKFGYKNLIEAFQDRAKETNHLTIMELVYEIVRETQSLISDSSQTKGLDITDEEIKKSS